MNKNFLDLEVPYGLHPKGYLVRADEADKETEYLCPQCESGLLLRAGEYMVRHFAHKVDKSCDGESIIHKTAKMLIAEVIRDQSNVNKRKPIRIQHHCTCCNEEKVTLLPYETFTSAYEEKIIGDYKCDVVAQKDDIDKLVIEVFFTHRVDPIKAANLPIHWVELTAESILINPHYWQPTQFKLKDIVCDDCKKHIRKLNSILDTWKLEPCRAAIYRMHKTELYLAEIEKCYKCKEEIPVYWWDGVPFCNFEPPQPRPRTIKFIYSKRYGCSYWANTCPNCKSIQGDNFLFYGLDGKEAVIKGLPLKETEENKKFRSQQMQTVMSYMLRNII